MSGERILLVEDERAQREGLSRILRNRGYEVDAVDNGEAGIELLSESSFSLVITDLRLPGMDGLEVVRRARQLDEELGVLLTTAYASIDSAVEALRVGAHDYLLKPLALEEVLCKVQNIIDQRELARENVRLRQALQRTARNRDIVAESAAMREVLRWVERAAATPANVLITGDTGTGKEVVAREIHRLSPQRNDPFLPVNLASLADNIIESELFGHERGAFTGADRRRDGILRAAGNGTVFLDEIAELPVALQPSLLRALESGEVRPVGSDRHVAFGARILAATHRDLKAKMVEGKFREDLYYRLNVIEIRILPLRERSEDIPVLVRELVSRHSERLGLIPPSVSGEAMRALCAHQWRGNVRELSNVLERSMLLVDGGRIEVEDLPEDVRGAASDNLQLSSAVEQFERGHIAMVLRLSGGNRDRAAEELGISPATLYRRLERLHLK